MLCVCLWYLFGVSTGMFFFSVISATDLGVYATLGMGQAVLVLLSSFCLAIGGIFGSRTLHDNMLANILRSPMSFFDTTPLGRILNRFSKVRIEYVYLRRGGGGVYREWRGRRKSRRGD